MTKLENKPFWPELLANASRMSIRELAERYNVSHAAIAAAFQRGNVQRTKAPPGPRNKRKDRQEPITLVQAKAGTQPPVAPEAEVKARSKPGPKPNVKTEPLVVLEPPVAPGPKPKVKTEPLVAPEPPVAPRPKPKAEAPKPDAYPNVEAKTITRVDRITAAQAATQVEHPSWLVLIEGKMGLTRVIAHDPLNAVSAAGSLGKVVGIISEDLVRKMLPC